MFETSRSRSASMSVDEVVALLGETSEVDGLALLGSTARGRLTPASDVDLLVVTTGPVAFAPGEPFEVVFTAIGGRPADIIVTTPGALRDACHEPLARWLAEGEVVLDGSGAIAGFVARAPSEPPGAWPDGAAYASWWSVSFEVTKAERYAAADDASYREAAAWLAMAAATETLVAYFRVRNLPWRGERAALAHWAAEDAAFADLVRQVLAAPALAAPSGLLRRLADRALEPAGGVWAPGTGPRSQTWERLLGD